MKKDIKKHLEFCLKYPELVNSFYKNMRWYNKQLFKNQVTGNISIKDLNNKINDGFIPVISLEKFVQALEDYKAEPEFFNKFEHLVDDWNNYNAKYNL